MGEGARGEESEREKRTSWRRRWRKERWRKREEWRTGEQKMKKQKEEESSYSRSRSNYPRESVELKPSSSDQGHPVTSLAGLISPLGPLTTRPNPTSISCELSLSLCLFILIFSFCSLSLDLSFLMLLCSMLARSVGRSGWPLWRPWLLSLFHRFVASPFLLLLHLLPHRLSLLPFFFFSSCSSNFFLLRPPAPFWKLPGCRGCDLRPEAPRRMVN